MQIKKRIADLTKVEEWYYTMAVLMNIQDRCPVCLRLPSTYVDRDKAIWEALKTEYNRESLIAG